MFLLGRNRQELFKHSLFISIKGVQTSYTKCVNKQKEGLDHTTLCMMDCHHVGQI